MSYELFQTRGGIIARDILQSPTYQEVYMLINLQTKNVSVILSDIVTACTNISNPPNIDRLHYHVATSTLLYYCGRNNTLLVIDEDTYTVELTIPTNINATFDEIKLVPQGYSIVILGMTGAMTQNPEPSQLITINLQTQTVATHVVFNYGLNTSEAVVGYAASSKNELYIITSTLTSEYQLTLYSMFLIGNSYTINNLTSFAFYTIDGIYTFPELYAVGTLVAVSYNQTLAVISSQGNVLGSVQDLAVKNGGNYYRKRIALAAQYGSSDFYALLANETLLKYSVQNAGYSVDTFASNIVDMQYISSNLSSDSLLFTIDTQNMFNITDLKTSQPIYSTISGSTSFMVTDTTYAAFPDAEVPQIYIFSRETNLLIYQGQVGYDCFYDSNSHLFSYMDYTNSSQVQCQMVQLDLQTTNSYVPFVLDPIYGTDCYNYYFVDITNDYDTPQFVLYLKLVNNVFIMSENFGFVQFEPFSAFYDVNVPFVDYDTLTVSLATSDASTETEGGVGIAVYTYEPSNQEFTYQNATSSDLRGYFVFIGPDQVVVTSPNSQLDFINMTTLDQTVISYTECLQDIDFFQDKTGAYYTILGCNANSNIYYDNQFTPLTGATKNTVASYSAGRCRYSIVDTVDEFSVASFYNVCSEFNFAEIYA